MPDLLTFFLQIAISALQSVLQEDFKATEIEVKSLDLNVFEWLDKISLNRKLIAIININVLVRYG